MSGGATPERVNPLEIFIRSPLARVLSILLLLLVLRIPVGMLRELIEERQTRRDLAIREVTGKWGREQSLVGPVLAVPYEDALTGLSSDPSRPRFVKRTAFFLPEVLTIQGDTRSEVRRRGIFEVPVYEARLRIAGSFAPPDFSDWNIEPEEVLWERAELRLEVSDSRVIQESVSLRLGDDVRPFEAGSTRGGGAPGIHAALPPSVASGADFAFDLRLRGSQGLYFTPFGRETTVVLASDWPHPSFQGRWLPAERSVDVQGFEARWHVPYLGRSYPQRWTSISAPDDAIARSTFGVDFDTPVDPYRLSERSAKYDALFIGLTFLCLWLFEVLAGVRVHAVQYGMVGAAMTLFYLLLLGFAEHVGFPVAYAIAAGGVVVLIGAYTIAVLGQRRRGGAVGAVVAALYGYLYVLLHNQDHALLVGSIGLFATLALVMWLTRRVDWSEALPAPPRLSR